MGILKKDKKEKKAGGVKFNSNTNPSQNKSQKEERGYDLYDFENLRKNKSVVKLIKSQGENKEPKIYSDPVTRINSDCERKLRILVISGKSMFILYNKNKSGAYKLKYVTSLSLITKVTICRKNTTLVKISVRNM